MRVFKNANYRFLSMRNRAYIVSAALIAIGAVSIVIQGGLRAGVEFTGGVLLEVQWQEETSVGEIRNVLTQGGAEGAQIQQLLSTGGDTQDFLLRVPLTEDEEGQPISEVQARVQETLAAGFAPGSFEVVRSESLSSRVGGEFQRTAIIAVLLSFVLTLIYLAFRFEWRFGFAAVIATVHDMAITFGFISVIGVEISLATVAAILTIIGYSLNDTIVVFDRVRENLRKKRKEPYEVTLNRSLNETLPRTVLTSGTTLMALVALLVFGGAVLRPFAAVLIMGVLVGTYSSIFVASPVLVELETRSNAQKARPAAARGRG